MERICDNRKFDNRGDAEARLESDYKKIDSGNVKTGNNETASAFINVRVGINGIETYEAGIKVRPGREFVYDPPEKELSPSQQQTIDLYCEAIDGLDNTIRNLPGNYYTKSNYKLKYKHAAEHGDDSALKLLPEKYSSGNRLLPKVIQALNIKNIHTTSELLEAELQDFYTHSLYGDKTIKAISALKEAALADQYLKWSLDKDMYDRIVKEKSRRSLAPRDVDPKSKTSL